MTFLMSPARRGILGVTGAVITAFLVVGGSADAFAAQPAAGQMVPGRPPAGLQRAAGQLVADGVPGVIIMTRRGQRVSDVVAGLADKATGQPMRPQDRVHIGSITKTFAAAVVLQLAAEGRLSLNDSVQKWLPGVITGHGYHPAQITIRQLLQHTSGLRDYAADPRFQTAQALEKTWRPQQLVNIALRLGPPVHGWLYSNTNYILLGMIIQKVTGHSPITEIRRRILVPLGLHDTSFPLTSKQIPAPYAHGYYGPLDVTSLVTSAAGRRGHDLHRSGRDGHPAFVATSRRPPKYCVSEHDNESLPFRLVTSGGRVVYVRRARRVRQGAGMPAARHLKYPSPDRCLSLQLAPAFVLQPRDQLSR